MPTLPSCSTIRWQPVPAYRLVAFLEAAEEVLDITCTLLAVLLQWGLVRPCRQHGSALQLPACELVNRSMQLQQAPALKA